ncbi:hypothetical protein CSB09_04370 [Candidatus Gracilibacteria bacterium]|nr:MAG: hypothetical protein CSB09_04370 [Candidatus Gracilibacteria bacterium]
MQTDIKKIQEKNEKGFFGFWVRKYRISYLIIIGLFALGVASVFSIPKESQPNVELDLINITTSYPGASPQDIDNLISHKIYKEIKNIENINKITSSSYLGFSSVLVTPKTGVDVDAIKDEINNNISNIGFPDDANDPVVQKLKFDSNRVFSLILYDSNGKASRSELSKYAKELKKGLERLSTIETVGLSISAQDVGGSNKSDDTIYKAEIILDEAKMNQLGLSLASVANTIRSVNIDIPVGNFEVNNKKYDYRIEDKNKESFDFLNIPIALPRGDYVTISEFATIQRTYKNDIDQSVLVGSGSHFFDGIGMTVNKVNKVSIFKSSKQAKEYIENALANAPIPGLKATYTYDLGEYIIRDYEQLGSNAIATIVLVFITMFLFIGLFDAVFATITLPLAFLSTFIILNTFDYSMNFLTNFSLLLSFGIAIDTIVVIVQAANAKTRLGYNPRSAISLAIREYAIPVISGVSTTIVVFVPMMILPGVMGKFLAFIPVTIFGVLVSGLALALTVNSAIYLLIARKKKFYIENETILEYMSQEEKDLLWKEREGKQKKESTTIPLRNRIVEKFVGGYRNFLTVLLHHRYIRRIVIFFPIILLFFIQIFVTPHIDFQMFPTDDNDSVTYIIKSENGINTKKMSQELGSMGPIFGGLPEMKYTMKQIKNNQATLTVMLHPKEERKAKNMRSVFEINDIIKKRLQPLETKGFQVIDSLLTSGPPGGHPIGIKLITQDYSKLSDLIASSKKIQAELARINGVKNIQTSSQDTPGQFIFQVNKEAALLQQIQPSQIYNTIITSLNGVKVATIEDSGEDMDVVLKLDTFDGDANIDAIQNITFPHNGSVYRVADFITIQSKNSIAQISRENGEIQIEVTADIEDGYNTAELTQKAAQLAKEFEFPQGIEYKKGGENEENADLIQAMVMAFFSAILVIFGILTLQFDSYSKPVLILYSVIMSFSFVSLGLLVTGNPFSMPFAIGFIAFTGVAVNHGIILIDAINQNMRRGMEPFQALVEAGSMRLEPMVVTTLTTVLGILPIALQDRFWAGMGFTIIFGLIAATFLTLFVTTSLYYELYTRQKGSIIVKVLKWIFTLPIRLIKGIWNLVRKQRKER